MADDVPRKVSRRRHPWILIAAATTALVLALALGLGLGLGLKHHHSNDSQTSPSTSALPLLTPQTSSNFVVGTIVGQSPQDRTYNFTVALANGAPDGVNKTMLVVNGACAFTFPCRNYSSVLHRPVTFTMIAGDGMTVLENRLISLYLKWHSGTIYGFAPHIYLALYARHQKQ